MSRKSDSDDEGMLVLAFMTFAVFFVVCITIFVNFENEPHSEETPRTISENDGSFQ